MTSTGFDDEDGRVTEMKPLRDSPNEDSEMLAFAVLLNVFPPADAEPALDVASTGIESCRFRIHGLSA